MAVTQAQLDAAEASRKLVNAAALNTTELTGVEFDPVAPIGSSQLQTEPDIAPQVAQPEPTPVVAPTEQPEIPEQFTIPEQLTAAEQEQSELIKRARGTVDSLTGEADFRKTAEEQEGIRQKRQDLQKIQARVGALQAEQLQIPLQLQEDSTGRGRTAGGLRPLETARTRTNAIAQLGANASFQAAAGNLALAQDFVDRAVAAEFDPKRAELDAILKNIELIKADPNTSLQERNRANETQARIAHQQAQLEQQAASKKAIGEYAVKSAERGATPEEVAAIQNSRSEEEALQRAASFLGADWKLELEKETFDRALKEAEYDLSVDRFDESRRQFGLSYAIQQRRLNIDENNKAIADLLAKGEKDDASELAKRQVVGNLNLIEKINTSRGLSRVVGPNPLARMAKPSVTGSIVLAVDEFLTKDGNEVRGYIKQLTDKATLQNLIDVKKQGATFGALQKAELEKLENAITAINFWEKKERVGGEDVGLGVWEVSESEFAREMAIIENSYAVLFADETGWDVHSGVIIPSSPDIVAENSYQGITLDN